MKIQVGQAEVSPVNQSSEAVGRMAYIIFSSNPLSSFSVKVNVQGR
jgi:hypothetical protein